jgi:hypothetical protein
VLIMTDEGLLVECKKGLGMPTTVNNFDGPLTQKLLAVKMYMSGSGISNTMIDSDLAVGAIVMGVIDIWNVEGGGNKFSPLFYDFLTHLAIKSEVGLNT